MKDRIFILRQKDCNVAVLIISPEGEIRSAQIINPERVPFVLTSNEDAIYTWWNERAIPEGREQLSSILKEYGCNSPKELLLKNLGLSLTDTYWVCPEEYSNLSFDDVNLFDHGKSGLHFHEADGRIRYTPDASLGGSLDKAAVLRSDGWHLEKQFNSRYPDGQQNINEVFVSELHRRQGWKEYTSYKTQLSESGVCEISDCRYFTSKDRELITAYELTGRDTKGEYEGKEELDKYVRLCVQGGLDEEYVRRSLDYMILMDYITTNSDRHWNNFGVLRDPVTLRLVSIAPIFDHGNAMFYDSPYQMNRTALIRLKNVGIEKWETRRLSLVRDKHIVKADLLPSPSEVKAFYEKYGLREDRAAQIAVSYGNKLDLFMEFQHGIPISLAREMDRYVMTGPPFVGQKPNREYFDKYSVDVTEEIANGFGIIETARKALAEEVVRGYIT